MPRIGLIALLSLVALAAGCSAKNAALDKYAKATLTAGAGLGDLRLGETTLDEFLRNIGKGRFFLAVSDESAFEFDFAGATIAFQFLIEGQCLKEIGATRDLHRAAHDLDAYLATHPACHDLTLSSISVASGGALGGSFFKGSTDQGSKLDTPITTSFGHGEATTASARMMAGLSPDNPDDAIEYPGIAFHYDRGASGKMEDTEIRRITVFTAK